MMQFASHWRVRVVGIHYLSEDGHGVGSSMYDYREPGGMTKNLSMKSIAICIASRLGGMLARSCCDLAGIDVASGAEYF